jgi:hypothetical protein
MVINVSCSDDGQGDDHDGHDGGGDGTSSCSDNDL